MRLWPDQAGSLPPATAGHAGGRPAAGAVVGLHRMRAIGSVGGENLGFLLLELISGDDTALPQVGQLGKLVRGTGLRARGFLDVTAEGLILPGGLLS